MAKRLSRCPVCEAALHITEMTCARCSTRIAGMFDACRFCRLAPEHLAFVETFLRCEGNLSRVEKELSLSYPTVRNRLSAALVALGFVNGAEDLDSREETAPPPANPLVVSRRRHILESLERGDMSAAEAAEALRGLG